MWTPNTQDTSVNQTGIPVLRGLCYKEGRWSVNRPLTNAGKSVLRRKSWGKHLGMGVGKAALSVQVVQVQETWVRFLGWEDPLEKG